MEFNDGCMIVSRFARGCCMWLHGLGRRGSSGKGCGWSFMCMCKVLTAFSVRASHIAIRAAYIVSMRICTVSIYLTWPIEA